MAMKELCPICIEMDARTFLNKVIQFGLDFKTVEELVGVLKLFGAKELLGRCHHGEGALKSWKHLSRYVT